MKVITARNFFIATIIGIILYVVLHVIALLLPPYYSPITQAESDLAVGPYGYIMTVNFLVRCLLSLSFIAGLMLAINSKKPLYRTGLVLLGIWAIGSAIVAFFPTDLSPPPFTFHGMIHSYVGIISFVAACLGAIAISLYMRNDNQFKDITKYTIPLNVLSVIGFVLMRFTLFGLFESILIFSILLWMLTISIYAGVLKEPN